MTSNGFHTNEDAATIIYATPYYNLPLSLSLFIHIYIYLFVSFKAAGTSTGPRI